MDDARRQRMIAQKMALEAKKDAVKKMNEQKANLAQKQQMSRINVKAQGAPNLEGNLEYQKTMRLYDQIYEALMGAREKGIEQQKPKVAMMCPGCGASTIPDSSGRCEYCTRALL